MTTLELLKAYSQKAQETKKELAKSFFSGDKSFYKKTLSKYPFCLSNGNVYETINNLSAKVAQNTDY